MHTLHIHQVHTYIYIPCTYPTISGPSERWVRVGRRPWVFLLTDMARSPDKQTAHPCVRMNLSSSFKYLVVLSLGGVAWRSTLSWPAIPSSSRGNLAQQKLRGREIVRHAAGHVALARPSGSYRCQARILS